MTRYRCGMCHKIVKRPEKRDWFRETCSKVGREAIMRKIESKQSTKKKTT